MTDSEQQQEATTMPAIKPVLVDYKSDTYKISVGDNYKVSDKIIDWSWAYLDDDDDKIDSSGRDSFMSLGEPLIQYNNSDYLPSLHITTDKNIITSFTCSVLFDLEDNPKAKENFLRILSKDIKLLQNDSIVRDIITTGEYKIIEPDYIISYKLTQGENYDYDRFEYKIAAKLENQR
jgi:hypothetical protein